MRMRRRIPQILTDEAVTLALRRHFTILRQAIPDSPTARSIPAQANDLNHK